ncbi:MAG: histidine kinase [Flavisolibacter sp.]
MQTSLLLVLCALYNQVICYSQNAKTESGHPSSTIAKGPLADAPAAEFGLNSLLKSLENTSISADRADIYFKISRYYSDRLKIDSALFYSEKIKDESIKAKYELGTAKYYLARSHALYFRNIKEPENLAKALEIFNRYNEPFYIGFTYRLMARQYNQAGDLARSRIHFHASIHYYTLAKAARELQHVNFELGRNFYKSFDTDSAAYYLITALQLAEKSNDHTGVYNASGTLGEAYLVADDLENAAKYLKYALDNRTPALSNILVRMQLDSYASCLMKLGEFDKAAMIIKEYEMINEKFNDNWGVIMYNKNKGKLNFHKKNYTEALKFLQLAYSRKNEIKSFLFDIRDIAGYLGKTEFELEQYDSAITHLSYVIQLARQIKFGSDLLEANLLISHAYEKKGNKDSALHYFRHYDHLKDSMLTFRKEKAVIELTTKYETGKKEQQIQLLQRQKELDAYVLQSQMFEIEKQNLADKQKSQQLALLSQQNEINRLEASEKTLAFDNQQKEMVKKQSELGLMEKENQLQSAIAGQESQRKNFAYLTIAAILIFSGYVLYRYIQNKKLSTQLAASLVDLKQAQEQLIKTEKEKEGDKIRVSISRDIHDEVGATLSGVALFSEIAREKIQQQQGNDAQIYLDHITANSKEMVEKISDIVWTIDPHNDSFERIIVKLQSFAVNLCAGKGIKLHFHIDDQVCLYSPPMQVRKNIYILMKESIYNAVKYS